MASYNNNYAVSGAPDEGIPGGRLRREPSFDPAYAARQQEGSQQYYDAEGSQQHGYPPMRSEAQYKEGEDEFSEKPMYPITRGSIAAQMAAEGQIPKKEGLRMWRSDEHAGALLKGGRGRCCGRVCGCSIILVLVIVVGVIASFFLWVRPPNVAFNGIGPPQSGQEVATTDNGFLLRFSLNIGVLNPNFFGASFGSIAATAFYSTAPNTPFGGGVLNNVEIPKQSNTTIYFPFNINYTTTLDTNFAVLNDIADRCGFLGNAKRQLTVDYTVKLAVKVIAITITPSFSSSTSFDCPLQESDIAPLLKAAGITLPNSRKRSYSEEELVQAQKLIPRMLLGGLTGRSMHEDDTLLLD